MAASTLNLQNMNISCPFARWSVGSAWCAFCCSCRSSRSFLFISLVDWTPTKQVLLTYIFISNCCKSHISVTVNIVRKGKQEVKIYTQLFSHLKWNSTAKPYLCNSLELSAVCTLTTYHEIFNNSANFTHQVGHRRPKHIYSPKDFNTHRDWGC